MLHREHSAILWTFIKLPFVIKIFVLSIFEWPFYTGFTVYDISLKNLYSHKSFLPNGNFFRLLITFVNSLNTDEDRQNVDPDLDSNCLTH